MNFYSYKIILLFILIGTISSLSALITKNIFNYLIDEINFLVYLSQNNLIFELFHHIIKLYLIIIFLCMEYPLQYHPRYINL